MATLPPPAPPPVFYNLSPAEELDLVELNAARALEQAVAMLRREKEIARLVAMRAVGT